METYSCTGLITDCDDDVMDEVEWSTPKTLKGFSEIVASKNGVHALGCCYKNLSS